MGSIRDPWAWYTRWLPAWVLFFLPILLWPFPLLLAAVLSPDALPKMASVVVTVVFAPDVAIISGLAFGLRAWVVLGCVLWVEVLFVVWLISNLEAMRRWRPAERFFVKRERRAEQIYRRHAWIRRFHFWGVAVFTFLPLGSGVIIGSFLAKFTGLGDRRTLGAVLLGVAVWSAFLTYVFAASQEQVVEWLEKIPWFD